MIRILVVDDHELVRTGLTRMLSDDNDIEIVGEAESGEVAVEKVRRDTPDLVLMDLRMPGIGGLEAIRRILRVSDEIRIVAVTACEDDPYPIRVMQAGAHAYLTKGADLGEMLEAVRCASRGQRYISPEIAQKMALGRVNGGDDEHSAFDDLSERELQIATMIVQCQKVHQISDRLCMSPKTVHTYRYRIFDKLGIESDVELTWKAVKYGIFSADEL